MKLNTKIFVSDHPFFVARSLAEKYEGNIIFEFSRYIYFPQQLFDKRETFKLSGKELNEAWLLEFMDSLGQEEELAFHSKVVLKGRKHHIPMIDFSMNEWSINIWDELRKYIERKILNELYVFSSGRSFHAYSGALLTPANWYEFMGRLLLVNAPSKTPIVDARWIGHRIIGGFCSLRWSCNTPYYIKYPVRINPFQQQLDLIDE